MGHYWFIPAQHRRITNLALAAFALAFVVILLGAYTRLTNAGLSCPDWPHCYGYITAPHTAAQLQQAAERYPAAPIDIKKAWTEMTHRYFAGAEGILILIVSSYLLFTRRLRNTQSMIIGCALIILLCTQVLLGMLTVTEKLKPVIVLGHLINGLSLLSILWWAFLNLRNQAQQNAARARTNMTPWLWLGLIILTAQVTLGGWVSTHYAGLACIDFPYCNGKLLPSMQWGSLNTDMITIHMLHRIGAMITAAYLSVLALFLWRNAAFKFYAMLLLTLVALQLTLGILNIIWLRPVWLALSHHTVAILLLLTMITLLVRDSQNQRS